MALKYPQPGDLYDSLLYRGQRCQVVSVLDAQVTFRWTGSYNHIEAQRAPVNQFIRDFTPSSPPDGN